MKSAVVARPTSSIDLFTGHGWRRRGQAGCTWVVHQTRTVSEVAAKRSLRCERPANHPGWHGNDDASWAPGAKETKR